MQCWFIFLISAYLLRQIYGQCRQDSLGNYLFGPTCEFLCHCKVNEQCNNVTGECQSGCAFPWVGRTCQHMDIGRYGAKKVLEAFNLKWAGYAIDKDVNTCTESKHPYVTNPQFNIYTPFWKDYITNPTAIQGLIIMTKEANIGDMKKGFNITVENITDGWKNIRDHFPQQSSLCYKHQPGASLNLTFRVQCTKHVVGNQIRIHLTNKKTHLALCDVSIFGDCPVNQCGPDCLIVCHCKEFSYQDKISGECSSGCAGRWTGTGNKCDKECGEKEWGSQCNTPCRNCKEGHPCNIRDGTCPNGCAAGYRGSTCLSPCGSGYFGDDCKQNCSTNCKGGLTKCNHITGYCEQNCTDGWTGDDCNKECVAGFYGNECQQSCSSNCEGGVANCDHVNGHCNLGCVSGFYGDRCLTKCSRNCVDGICDDVSGRCLNGCRDGWKGDNCTTECTDGWYGWYCKKKCGNCLHDKPCSKTNGMCTNGCAAGYKGDDCFDTCPEGFYGEGCQKRCSGNCQGGNSFCNHITGHCKSRCMDGWEGNHCGEECSEDFYGKDCQQRCSGNCQGGYDYCNHISGQCEYNCTEGWEGDHCDQECPDGSYGLYCSRSCGYCTGGKACAKTNGTCIQGCDTGYYEPLCDQECNEGLFGFNCANTCGHCLDGKPCRKTDGVCLEGCESSYQGPDCIHECTDGLFGFNCTKTCGYCLDDKPCRKSDGVCQEGCESSYQGSDCFQPLELREDTSSSSPDSRATMGIVGGIIFLLIVMAVVALVIYRRRGQSNEKPSKSQTAPLTGNIGNTTSKPNANKQSTAFINIVVNLEGGEVEAVDPDTNNVYYNTMSATGTAIYLHVLKDYTIEHCKTTKLVDDFKTIPYGLRYATNIARKPANLKKNRYKDMYPYDYSRVILNELPGEPDSDYINASYINGYGKENTYIAAQGNKIMLAYAGPIENNVADFWRMVWEKYVNTIVMLTNPIEKGKMKCIEYWNQKETEDIQIVVSLEEKFAEMIIRTITMHKVSTNEDRDVVQYHFTAWPDKATPNGACGLVHFLHKCRTNYVNTDPPVVVHCSAGVGRTGTYMALDILYEEGRARGHVDIFSTVENLRIQRLNTVQTKGQYVFLHEAVYEALVLPEPISIPQFAEEYCKIQNEVGRSREAKLVEQYKQTRDEILSQKMRNHFNDILDEGDEFAVAQQAENREKNRFQDILAANEFRPFLSTNIEGCSNYINAVYMPSYRTSHAFLVTQAPLQCTAVDCCRLIYERSIEIVVTFDNSDTTPSEKYLPDRGTLKVGPFETKLLSKKDKNGYIIRSHQFSYKGHKANIKQAVYTGWAKGQTIPANPNSFLDLLQEIQTLQRSSDEPILIQCLNGAEKSGLFVVMLNVLERMRIEGDVAIHQIIRQLRKHRQQIIPNLDQYKVCHDLALLHIEVNNTYANI